MSSRKAPATDTLKINLRLMLLGLGALAALALLAVMLLQPLNPAVANVILLFVIVLLGSGLVTAVLINIYTGRRFKQLFEDEKC